MIVLRRLALGLTCLLIAVLSDGPVDEGEKTTESGDTQTPGWVGPMRKVHARCSGDPGTFAQFGDSIADSRAFWFSLKWKRGNASEEMLADFELVRGHMFDDCWDRKGAGYGNQSGQTIRWASKNVDHWLRQWNPEAAILMFGTIPPRHGREEKAAEFAAAARRVAKKLQVPLTDFHAEILRRRADDWRTTIHAPPRAPGFSTARAAGLWDRRSPA